MHKNTNEHVPKISEYINMFMQDILQRSAVLFLHWLLKSVGLIILQIKKITFAQYLTFNADIFYVVAFLKWRKKMVVTASQILSSLLCFTICVIQIKEALTDFTNTWFKLLRIQ